MILERRTYTLKPGQRAAFLQAQRDRGFAPVSPICERLLGYFVEPDPAGDRVVHLYRYDDFGDWQARLHGLYAVPELRPYFGTVRKLMARQDNVFLAPVPVPLLTPVWGPGRDWLPGQGPVPAAAGLDPAGAVLVEESFLLRPGQALGFLDALASAAPPGAGSLGWFAALTGRLHRHVHYELFASRAAAEQARPTADLLPPARLAGWAAEHRRRLLLPMSDIGEMVPLFGTAA